MSGVNEMASFHFSQPFKVCNRRQEDPTNCLARLGEQRRRISRFIEIGGQAHLMEVGQV